MQTITIKKSYPLTDEESLTFKDKLISELNNRDELINEFEKAKTAHKEVIKYSEDMILWYRRILSLGTQDVIVEINYNVPENGKKTIIRSDTGEKVIEDMLNEEIAEFPCKIPFIETEETEEPNTIYKIENLTGTEVPKSKYQVGDRIGAIFTNTITNKKETIIGLIDYMKFDAEQEVWLYTVVDDNRNMFCLYQYEIKEIIKNAEAN